MTLDLRFAEVALPPAEEAQAAIARLAKNVSALSPLGGMQQLRTKIVDHILSFGLSYSYDGVIVTAGATQAFSSLILAQASIDDIVVLPNPGLASHLSAILNTGRNVAFYTPPKGPDDFSWVEQIEQAGGAAKVLLWVSPHTPTGHVASLDQCREVARLVNRYELFLICDEVFSDLVWDVRHETPLRWVDAERSAGIWSASKSLRLPGHRVGWIATAPSVGRSLAKISWSLTMGATTIGQAACLASLDVYSSVLSESRKHLRRNMEIVHEGLKSIWNVKIPGGGSCFWINIANSEYSALWLQSQLYKACNIRVLTGEAFGETNSNHIRISAGADGDIIRTAVTLITELIG